MNNNSDSGTPGFDRAKRILAARAAGPDVARAVEDEIIEEILGAQAQELKPSQMGLRPFEAMEFAGELLRGAFLAASIKHHVKAPSHDLYHPLFASKRHFSAVWKLCKAIDQLGLPYEIYIHRAVERCMPGGKRRFPSIKQLLQPHIVEIVMREYLARPE